MRVMMVKVVLSMQFFNFNLETEDPEYFAKFAHYRKKFKNGQDDSTYNRLGHTVRS